jgi:hypothetical protein
MQLARHHRHTRIYPLPHGHRIGTVRQCYQLPSWTSIQAQRISQPDDYPRI